MLQRLHAGGPATRSDLGAATGLNRSTVATLVADLEARGLVRERRSAGSGTPGRPSTLVELRDDTVAVLSLEVFADSLAAALVGLGGRVFAEERIPRTGAPEAPQDVVRQLGRLAHDVLARRAERIILAVGVAVAGVVRREDGFVEVAPNLGWRGVPIGDLLRAALAAGDPPLEVPVLVGNDAELATRAEHVRGSGLGTDDFLLLWGEQGIGAGVIAGGRPLLGRSGYAGEVGHLPLSGRDLPCRCGARGCWETEIGEQALIREAGIANGSRPRLAVERVLTDAEAGDERARAAVDCVGRSLGAGIAGLVNLLNPSRIALAGYLARIYPLVADQLTKQLDMRGLAGPRAVVVVVPAALGADAPLLGAAEFALSATLDDPTLVARRAELRRSGAPNGRTRTRAKEVSRA